MPGSVNRPNGPDPTNIASWRQAPPPWAFALALALALAGLAPLLRHADRFGARADPDRFYATPRLARLRGPGPLRVVAIGSSLVGCGLAFDGDLEALGAAQGHPLRFVRFTHAGRKLDSIPPLLDRIARQPPDLLVLEAEFLVWGDRPVSPLRYALADRRQRLFQAALLGLIRLGPGGRDPDAGAEANRAPDAWERRQAIQPTVFDGPAYLQAVAEFGPQRPDELAAVLAGLAELRRRGCRVVLLPMGRSAEAQALFPAEQTAVFRLAVARLAASGFPVDPQAPPLPPAGYLDAAHLNAAGQVGRSRWFIAQLDRWEGRP